MMQDRSLLFRFLLVGFAVLSVSTFSSRSQADCVLRVGWDAWPPYITYENGQFQGPEYDLLKSTADAAACRLQMIHVPWVRALKMLSEDQLDLLYGADYSPERAKFAKFSIPYRQERFVLMTHGQVRARENTGKKIKTVSLRQWLNSADAGKIPHKLGLFRGNFYGEQIERVLKDNANNVTIIYLGNNLQMVRMLGLGRLDGYIVEDGVAQTEIPVAGYPLQRSIIAEQVSDALYYMFSLKTPNDIVQRFDNAIRHRQLGEK